MVQLYAADDAGDQVFVECAVKGVDYFCLECWSKLRLRGGDIRQLHFYHVDSEKKCRQSEKTIEHIMTQRRLQESIDGIQLEVRFPNINRIADAVWDENKIVFEVQVSPMTADECKGRIEDYKKEGFDTIFILHTKSFGKRFTTPLEVELDRFTHYFTDIDEISGDIFDMLAWIIRGRRLFIQDRMLKKLVIDIATLRMRDKVSAGDQLTLIQKRRQNWKYQAEGDLLSRVLQPTQIEKALILENALKETVEQRSLFDGAIWLLKSWYQKLIEYLYIRP